MNGKFALKACAHKLLRTFIATVVLTLLPDGLFVSNFAFLQACVRLTLTGQLKQNGSVQSLYLVLCTFCWPHWLASCTPIWLLIQYQFVLFLLIHATSMQVSIASNGIITWLSIRKTRVKLFVYIISHLIRWLAVCTSLFVNVHSCKLELI